MEIVTNLHKYAQRSIYEYSFEAGCIHAYSGVYEIEMFCKYNYQQLEDPQLLKQCIINYNIGFMHTITCLDEDNVDDIDDYKYNIKAVNNVSDIGLVFDEMNALVYYLFECGEADYLNDEITWSDNES